MTQPAGRRPSSTVPVEGGDLEDRLAEAKEKVWPGEVAGLEQALINLRQRKAEAEDQLSLRRNGSIGSTTG